MINLGHTKKKFTFFKQIVYVLSLRGMLLDKIQNKDIALRQLLTDDFM